MSEKINKISTLFSKATGQELNMNTYDHRLMLQKLVYIVQEAGIKFGYSYNWYVKGPYCTELTRDSFEFFNHSQKIHKTTLTESENKLIESFKKYFKSDLKNDEKLELLGSLVFIIKDWEIKNKEEIIEKLISLKPWYEKKEIEEMLEKIQKSKLFN